MNGENKKFSILSGTALKLFAAVFMAVDHVGYMFFPKLIRIRMIGRVSLPIFAFCIAEGFAHTGSKWRYLGRMLLFALVSELPFDLAFFGKWYWKYQNVMFSFALAILALYAFEKGREKGTWWSWALGIAGAAGCAWAASALHTDYGWYAVVLVLVFYVFRGAGPVCSNAAAVLFQVLTHPHDVQTWSIVSFFPLMLYNGKKGRGLKWFFYVFYPGHLLLLCAFRRLLFNR